MYLCEENINLILNCCTICKFSRFMSLKATDMCCNQRSRASSALLKELSVNTFNADDCVKREEARPKRDARTCLLKRNNRL